METIIFGAWLILIFALFIYSVWKKNPSTLMLAGLMLLVFGYDLTFNGLQKVNGFDSSTGLYIYTTVSVVNDLLFGVIALGSFVGGFAIIFYCVMLLYREFFERNRSNY